MTKRLLVIAAIVGIALAGCETYDDTEIRNQLSDHERRIAALETAVAAANSQISGVQATLSSIQQGDHITSVVPTADGYIINFANRTPITIRHGADGRDGTNGQDGQDGRDGVDGQDGRDGQDAVAPIIGVALYNDVYYWTVTTAGETEWIKDGNSDKIRVTGAAGQQGNAGENGLTPVISIDDDGYWMIQWGDNAAEHLTTTDDKKVLSRVSNIPFRLEVRVDKSELVFDFYQSGNVIRIPFAQPFNISIEGVTDYTLFIGVDATREFTVNVANITAADYLSLSAEIVGRAGNATDVHIRTRSAATTGWGVEIVGNPEFNAADRSATFTLKITAPEDIDEFSNEANARLTLSLLGRNGIVSTAAYAIKLYRHKMTMTTAQQGTVWILLLGTGTVYIDWGNGYSQAVTLVGGTYLTLGRNYPNSTPRTITIIGNVTALINNNNGITSLDVSGNTALTLLSVRINQLDAVALDALFETLHDNTGAKTIFIGSNPGTDDCNPSIAEAKGWVVNTTTY